MDIEVSAVLNGVKGDMYWHRNTCVGNCEGRNITEETGNVSKVK